MGDELTIEYQEVSADKVMAYFVEGFKPKAGEIKSFEWYYDPHKGTVIFKLYVRDERRQEKEK